LLRPTTPPPDEPQEGDDAGELAEPQGRGAAAPDPKPARPRRKRPPVSSETKGRKLHLPDDVHDRLWLLARQRRQSVSAVAAEILDRSLPRFKVEREG
jgi:hypothetical protein